MSGFLLDTNCISEVVRARPEPRVLAWMEAADERLLFLSVLTLGEIRKGIAALPQSKRRTRLESWLENGTATAFRRQNSSHRRHCRGSLGFARSRSQTQGKIFVRNRRPLGGHRTSPQSYDCLAQRPRLRTHSGSGLQSMGGLTVYYAAATLPASSQILFHALSTCRSCVLVCPTQSLRVSFPSSLVCVRNKSPLRFSRSRMP